VSELAKIEGALTAKPTRAQIVRLEDAMRQLPQMDLPPEHFFAEGLYARVLNIPAGTLLTGKVHRREHVNILAAGEITVWTEDGMRRIAAPHIMVSRPGTKRVGYAHTDTTWITVHATKCTDPQAAEDELVEPDMCAIEHVELSALPEAV